MNRYLWLGFWRSHLDSRPVEGPPLLSREPTVYESIHSSDFFQCGKRAAHSKIIARATTAGLEIASRAGGLCDSALASRKSNLWTGPKGLRIFRRIVKKRTKLKSSNRPERRVSKATATDGGCLFLGDDGFRLLCSGLPLKVVL